MESYRSLETARDSSTLTTDLDAFLSGVYRYYSEKGLRPVIFRSVSNLVASVFTFVLSVAVLLLIDWGGVLSCTSEDVCLPFFYPNPIAPISLYRGVILFQLVPMGLYTVVLACLSAFAKVREAIRVSEFYKSALSVPDDDILHFLTWEEVVKRLCAYQASAENPLCIVQDQLSPLEIHSIILRTENISLQIFKRWYSIFVEPNGGTVLGQLPLQSTAIKWCVQHTIVSWMFTERYRIRTDLSESISGKIKARFRLVGFLSAILIGPVFIFSTLLLFIKETEDVRANRSSLFQKEFSGLAQVALGHFGEMPHDVMSRLKGSVPIAVDFSKRIIPDKSIEATLNVVKFVAGGIVAVLAVTAIVQDTAVLYMTILGKNLLFHLAFFSTVVGIASGLASTPSHIVNGKTKEIAAKKLLSSVHYLPCPHGTGSAECDSQLVKAKKWDCISSSFCDLLFKTKLVNLVYEIAGILLLPLYFLIVFPDTLADIIGETKIHHSENLGDFAASAFLVPGVCSTDTVEMTSLHTTSVGLTHSSKERAMSFLFYAEKYGSDSGVSKPHISVEKEANDVSGPSSRDEFSTYYHYLVANVAPYSSLFDRSSLEKLSGS